MGHRRRVTLRGGLEFRLIYHLCRGKERRRACRPLREEEMTFRRDEWALRK